MNIFDELNNYIELADGSDGWIDEEDNWHELTKEIGNFLSRHFEQYDVERVTAFESCGCDAGVVCMAWIDDGNLQTHNIKWRRT